MFYAIHAYSRTANQTQRELAQDELQGRPITDRVQAQRMADSFAQRLNQRQLLKATDWVGQIELVNNTNIQPL